MEFETVVELGGKTATGFEVPAEVMADLGTGKRFPVRVTINGHTYRSTTAVMGGRTMLPLNAGDRTKAGVAAGDRIRVDVTLDTEPRTVTVPDDLAAALGPAARRAFDGLSYTQRKEHVRAVEDAKTPQTRQRRIDAAVAALNAIAAG